MWREAGWGGGGGRGGPAPRLLPVTVIVELPAAAVPGSRLKVAVPLAATLVGEMVAVAPAGAPETLSAIEPANPPEGEALMVAPPAPVTLAALAASEKSGLPLLPAQSLPKQTERIAGSSMPLGATPVWPCMKSKNGTPTMVTVSPDSVNEPPALGACLSKAARAPETPHANEPPDPTH